MKKTIEQIDVKNKRVLLRVDFNVPLDDDGNITDDTRILAEMDTIKYLLNKGAKLIICSHLGRPDGKRNEKMSLVPVAKRLISLLLNKVVFASDILSDEALEKANKLKSGQILLLENLRFYPGEEKNDPAFAKRLAEFADIYVNDAFGTAHRRHASTYGVAKLLPNAVGFLMGREINTISGVIDNPEKPFVLVAGGAKVSDKIYVIMNLLKKCDSILIGGGMAYTFLKAKGFNVGNSLVEEEKVSLAYNILQEAERSGVNIYLPVDHMCARNFSAVEKAKHIKGYDIPDGWQGLDIGPRTIKLYSKVLKNARTAIWNGPMGVFEFKNFSKGTEKIANAVAKVKGKTIVGGGDSIAAIHLLKKEANIYHISTGGGASLKLLEGEILPGVDVIENI